MIEFLASDIYTKALGNAFLTMSLIAIIFTVAAENVKAIQKLTKI